MSDLDTIFTEVNELLNQNKAYEAARKMQDYGNQNELDAITLGHLFINWLEAKAAN